MRRIAAARVRRLRRDARQQPLHLVFGTHSMPHPDKLAKGGEDAFFADDASGSFGVADGVGGSARNGVDPGVFSRRLLELCQQLLSSDDATLPRALKGTGSAIGNIGGSSTVLLSC